MTLLYLSLSYLTGVLAGRLLWQLGILDCRTPNWIWILVLIALPLALWREQRGPSPGGRILRWPVTAGFVPPRPAFSGALAIVLMLAFAAGLFRYASRPLDPCLASTDLAFYNALEPDGAEPVTVFGTVSSYPLLQGDRQILVVRAQSISNGNESFGVDGRLRLSTSLSPRVAYGQPVQVTGILQEPPVFDDFDYRAYLAGKGIHSVMQRPRLEASSGPRAGSPVLRAIYRVRSDGESLLKWAMPEPYAALANGMLLGIESGIPDELYEAFNRTGASHVIVISGSNVALLSGVILAVGVRLLGQHRALWPTLAGISLYTLLVGADASVTRAALMGSLFVTAASMQRQSTALVSLGTACWTMALLNPLTVWDVGFQLSAGATADLILFSPVLTAALERAWPEFGAGGHLTGGLAGAGKNLIRGLVTDGVLMTLAATLTTMPLLLFHFGRVSLVSVATNLFIAPVQPFILLWGSAGLLVGLAGVVALAQALLWIPYLCLVWTVTMVHWTDSWPGGSLVVSGYGAGALVLTYLAMAILLGWQQLVRGWDRVWRRLASALGSAGVKGVGSWVGWASAKVASNGILGALGVAGLLTWWVVLTQPDGYLHVRFLDVGQGDGIFIQTPGGRQILVDGGRDAQVLFNQLGAAMPFWDRSLDLLLLSHPDDDHMAAQIFAPERYRVGQAVVSGVTLTDRDGQEWRTQMASAGVPVTVQGMGGWIDLGDGVALWTLWPPEEPGLVASGIEPDDKNERSLVTMLVYGDLRLLLTGDAGLPAEAAMVEADMPLAAQVLKVGHHGSDSSTGARFVDAVNPSVAVIQVGENRYGHPTQTVLDTLTGRLVLRNDEEGPIHIRSDGRRMWISVE